MKNQGDTEQAETSGAEPAVEPGLHAGGVTFDSGDAALFRAIDAEGSISAAAATLDSSNSRAHKRLQSLEAAFGPLVDTERGGSDGGGTELTDRARTLLARFDRLRSEVSGVTTVEETVYDGCVVSRDGELGTVWTLAGELTALVPLEGTKVQVTIRADTVTLHDPKEAPSATATSARNLFRGTVSGVDERTAVVVVRIDIGAPTPLTALLTRQSATELSVQAGNNVVVSFKTTATRATPR